MDRNIFDGSAPNLFDNFVPPRVPMGRNLTAPSTARSPVSPLPTPLSPGKPGMPKSRIAIIVLVVLIVLAALYVFVYLRRKNARITGPFAEQISGITDPERQADMREWNYLWTVARRPQVKNVLHDVLTSELTGSGSSSGVMGGATSDVSYSHSSQPAPTSYSNATLPPQIPIVSMAPTRTASSALGMAHLADASDPNFIIA